VRLVDGHQVDLAAAHVPPGAVDPPDPDAPAGEFGFKFDRSGYRVPAILVSPWIPKGSVFNDEYRHTSLIATLRKCWSLGQAFTQRDAMARTFDDLFTLEEPRDPQTWADITALPVPASHLDKEAIAKGLSGLGKNMVEGVIAYAKELGVKLPSQLDDPDAEITPEVLSDVLRQVAWHFFPLLAPDAAPNGV
jgi:phospholipase C